MKPEKILIYILIVSVVGMLCTGCGDKNVENPIQQDGEQMTEIGQSETVKELTLTSFGEIDMTKWNYQEEDQVYWQVGITYCEKPADTQYETMGIFVPAAYMTGTKNDDDSYTCQINTEGKAGDYTAETAPVVIPVETPGYSAMAAPTGYVSSVAQYTKAGFVYVYAGARGRDAGAPAGVTDLKAAIRYVRYLGDTIPGNKDAIFSFGMSGGGAQSALLGATGDSDLYTAYLDEIGAVTDFSDAVMGSMCWCPITSLDMANEAYEWNLGSSRTGLNNFEQGLSDALAERFAEYINEIRLTDEDGNVLTLETSEEGIYQAGSYYAYVKQVIEDSLNVFLANTQFPYTPSSDGVGMGPGGHGQGGMMRGDFDPENMTDEEKAAMEERFKDGGPENGFGGRDKKPMDEQEQQYAQDGVQRNDEQKVSDTSTYETAEDYIASLNKDKEWIIYDKETNRATITTIADFVAQCKTANKDLGAFDDLNAVQGENVLFGYGDGSGAHFDSIMAELLTGSEYEQAYAEDLEKTDAQGNKVDMRMNMYNPMYYLDDSYQGFESSHVAKFWRIRTGINQADTSLTTEINLALALQNYGDTQVDFATVWGSGHTKAEITGDSDANFIAWVQECMKQLQ